jgi:hypothetical protein
MHVLESSRFQGSRGVVRRQNEESNLNRIFWRQKNWVRDGLGLYTMMCLAGDAKKLSGPLRRPCVLGRLLANLEFDAL